MKTFPELDPYVYQSGFNNEFESEAIAGSIPKHQNTPKHPPFGLYAEQVSGTSFTTPRNLHNYRTWLYKIRPSVVSSNSIDEYSRPVAASLSTSTVSNGPYISDFADAAYSDSHSSNFKQTLWTPFAFPQPDKQIDFIDGISTISGSGSPSLNSGLSIHIYSCNSSMTSKSFFNSDGDFLIVPQAGVAHFQTELGYLSVQPGEIIVIPRGIKFRVFFPEDANPVKNFRGYILEVYGAHFELPDLGPIGSNGLASPRDFLYPVAAFDKSSIPAPGSIINDNSDSSFQIIQKFNAKLFSSSQQFSPFDVVSWTGNYAPYKYNLANFIPVNAVIVDHSDPSIFTVLTAKSLKPGTAIADFVIFPPNRINPTVNTFRPSYYHRNVMSEFMGCISGTYDARDSSKFKPGSASLHNCLVPHGPFAATVRKELFERIDDEPSVTADEDLTFMFETMFQLNTTTWALDISNNLYKEYYQGWQDVPTTFKLPSDAKFISNLKPQN
ncbi:Homogentisate 1,2-dioxygenase [Smittium culicis]|uniref:homogentisate 1,2-dioxygenase n=1 Tax=Smittium culicis TaxID=133412 RepID=A0A1R1X8K4_9FUNG|nr:Homogentisate 1,2-dioxygenase [Smittium culicis]OMJ15845.1 Homogentisate 1,2-dioxygenase [Smittium culicis]